MDQKLIQKASTNMSSFREDILRILSQSSTLKEATTSIEAIPLPTLEDMIKRKRSKNSVPTDERCSARRASGERCTRRKKEGSEYCGTHMKGTPHGIVDGQLENKVTTQKIEVWAQDIQGIIYYIDKANNVYQAEDIIVNKVNPKIIAKYVKNGDHYSIPEFNI